MTVRTVVVAIATLLLCGRAAAESLPEVAFGDGAFEVSDWSMLARANAKPLQQLGSDVIRFTFDPGSAVMLAEVFELRSDGHNASFEIIWLDRAPRMEWRPVRRRSFRMSQALFAQLATEIDEQMAIGRAFAARIHAGEEPSVICVDGFSLVTERYKAGVLSWMEGDCGEQPNHVIRALLNDWALQYLGVR
jgi:hypothetical protein